MGLKATLGKLVFAIFVSFVLVLNFRQLTDYTAVHHGEYPVKKVIAEAHSSTEDIKPPYTTKAAPKSTATNQFSLINVAQSISEGKDVRLVQDGDFLREDHRHKVLDPEELKVTYESCLKVIDKKIGPPPIPMIASEEYGQRKIHWFHLPKCGSTFGVALYSLVCQKEPSPYISPYTGEPCDYCGKEAPKGPRWDTVLHDIIDFEGLPYCNWNVTTSTPRANYRNHVPLPLDNRPMQSWLNMGLFRDPRKRLVSGWNHDKHAMGIAGPDRVTFENQVTTISQYIGHRSIKNCATKMLIGAYCARNRNLTVNVFEEAKRRLMSFAFVGLTDNFNASACLFSRMYGVQPQKFMFGAHARPGESHRKRAMPGGGERVPKEYWKNIKPSDDPLDWEIYQLAKSIFLQNLQRYGFYDMDYRKLERGIQA